ncbi:MAG: ABC transporter substrate-binding protein [Desulfobacca sp.]|nr:ABC transporter substrate-binding protein [Desulfobacca sp.]
MREIFFYIFFLLFLLTPLTLSAETGPLKKAVFIPHWSPQAQFAGYYVAYEKGLYKKYGLDLTIIPGGPARSPIEYLGKNKATFGSLWLCSALEKRAEGLKLVNIAQIMQKSALMLVAKKSSGIKTIQDLEGKKVGLWRNEFQIQPRALFKKYNLKIKVIPQSFSVNLFLRDGVDLASAMWYNEYHTILNSGLNPEELTPIFFYEHGLNFPEDGLYCLEDTIKMDPQLAQNFVKASLEGWLYAFSHTEETLDILLKYMTLANVPANRVHQKWMLSRMKDLIIDQEQKDSFGTLNKIDYDRVAGELKAVGLIRTIPDFKSFYQGRSEHVRK